jgi:gliding motility-associated-like protein
MKEPQGFFVAWYLFKNFVKISKAINMRSQLTTSSNWSPLKWHTKIFLLTFGFAIISSFKSLACTPMAIPTLSTQSVVGNNLELVWISNTAWACAFKIEVEIKCLGANFTGLAPFYTSTIITKPNTSPMEYPVQSISLATLCPGTAYQFRARENNPPGTTPSGWTVTYTFVTPGNAPLPSVQPMTNPTICPTNTAQLVAQMQNLCGPGPVTYSWSPPTGLSCITCSNPVASPTVNTTYTVTTAGGPLSCWTATAAVTVYTSSGTGTVLATATQVSCSNSLSAVSLTTAGSASVPASIVWNPNPATVSGNSMTASGLATGITTVVVTDQEGCIKSITVEILPAPPPVTFTVVNLTGSNSITCTYPTINLDVITNYTYGTLSYSWTSPSYTANTPAVTISAANTLTIFVIDLLTNCYQQQTVVIGSNTISPSNTVNPVSQIVTCNSGSPVTFTGTALSPTVNLQHDWYSPMNPLPGGVPIASSNNVTSVLSGLIPPGVYTLQTTDLVNGCTTQKTVTVTSLNAYPTFNVSSPTNFSIGCSPLHQTTIAINNPQSTQIPPGVCSYTFLAPTFTGAVTQSVVLGGNAATVVVIPGTWTVIVQDNSNWCRTMLSVPILQNTVAPNVSASLFTQTLTCKHPTVIGTGTTSTANTNITWGVPATPPLLSTSSLVIGPENGPNTSTTSLTYANYTVIATNTINACQSTSVITINQNFKPPVSSPTISIGTPTAIYCTVGDNPVILTTGASTVTSGVPFAFAANPCWAGPSPQTPTCAPSTYSCYVPGIYSLTIEDSYNGCLRTGTINVLDRTQPPVITVPVAGSTLDCGSTSGVLEFVLTGTTTGGMRYLITEYPHDAAFTPTSAIVFNSNPLLSGTTSSVVSISEAGTYLYMVSNTLTGCQAEGTVHVYSGGMTAGFEAQPASGYAPLNVNFLNQSSSSLNSLSITSVWSFGNGTSQTTTSNINPATTFTAPGHYTVMLLASKGSCKDTVYKVIRVDMPSKFEVPNVFTPNGDGSNDLFFLKAANLNEVKVLIFDRWGNKVYDVTSNTGNFAWDGKNFEGVDCAAGMYFYTIRAVGSDDQAYQQKGHVSLFR